MIWRILPLDRAAFAPLFRLSEAELHAAGARRMLCEAPNSAPCRVSLADAEPGETLILAGHAHLTEPASPYRSQGPVFVREGASATHPPLGHVPEMIVRRLLSVRVYDAEAMMTDADVVEGRDLAERLDGWFADHAVAQIHIHTARRGCYLARAARSGDAPA
jgi:hypothetical protein